MGDDSVVFRNTSAVASNAATTLLYDNVRAVNLAKVFAGQIPINGRLDMFRVGSLSGVGAINPLSSNGMEGLAFGNASTLTTDATSPNGVRASSRGSIATVEGAMAQGMFVKEISDTASTGWARVETSYIQSISYASSITPAHNNGNVAVVGTLTGNMTVNTMAASGTYVAGLKMRFLFTSDGSARTVSWNATWKGATLTTASAANQKAIVEFQYDGASWVQTFSTGWYS